MKASLMIAIATVFLIGVGWLWTRSIQAETAIPVRVGQPAPDFTLQDQSGNAVTLSQFIGHHTVVLYFYPKDDTPGCTKEACSFRDDIARFEALNARVLGVSIDGLDSHRAFAEKYRLNFPLLSDEDHLVSRAYGVFSSFVGFSYAKRTTFVIAPDGTIGRIITDVDPNDHAAELLRYLRDLRSPSASVSASEG